MVKELLEKKEKKVEYVELIYDLIFVYIIGRNNSLLHHIEDGFIPLELFSAYVFCTLAVIQIWNYTTYYINIYGRHSARDHIFLFINMFLLYFVAEGTGSHWQQFHTQYHVAWALILINIAAQYLIELKNHGQGLLHRRRIQQMACILCGETVIVLLAIAEYAMRQSSYCSMLAILLSMVFATLSGQKNCADTIDFPHLSERAMLYVVFTFGEMIIAIASYFDGALSVSSLYFSAMAFLIVVGLFLSYGVLYDHILHREKKTNGLTYMLLHIFIIFSLNNLSTALEFMRSEDVALSPKLLFLLASLLVYYFFLFLTAGLFASPSHHLTRRLCTALGAGAAVFIALMLLLRQNMMLNIALTVLFVFTVFAALFYSSRQAEK